MYMKENQSIWDPADATGCRTNIHPDVSIKQLSLQSKSFVSEIGETVAFVSDDAFLEQTESIRIGFSFRMGQTLVFSQMDQRRLVVKGSRHRHVVEFDALVQLIVFATPAPEYVGIAVEILKIMDR